MPLIISPLSPAQVRTYRRHSGLPVHGPACPRVPTIFPPRHKIQTQRNQTSKRLKTHIPRLSLCAQPLRTYTISPVTTHLESLDIGGFYGHPETRKARLTDGLSSHLCELCSRT